MGKIKEALTDKKNYCVFADTLKSLDVEDNFAITDAIVKGRSGYVISEALLAGGYRVAPSTVAMHIKRGCKCYGQD